MAEAGFAAIEALLEGLLCPVFSDKPFSSCWAPFTAGHILGNRWKYGRMYEDQEIYAFSSNFEMRDG